MANRVMPLLNLPTNDYMKKFSVRLFARVLEGVARRELIELPGANGSPAGGTFVHSRGIRSDETFIVRFNANAIQDVNEAAAIIGLLQQPYVRKILFQSPTDNVTALLLPVDAQTLSPTELIGPFRTMFVMCDRDVWNRDCLNEDQRMVVNGDQRMMPNENQPRVPNEGQRRVPFDRWPIATGVCFAGVLAVHAVFLISHPHIAYWILVIIMTMLGIVTISGLLIYNMTEIWKDVFGRSNGVNAADGAIGRRE